MKQSMRRNAEQAGEDQTELTLDAKDEPSWFFEQAHCEPRDVLVERYRRHLAQEPSRSSTKEHVRTHLGYRDLISARPGSIEIPLSSLSLHPVAQASSLRSKPRAEGLSVYTVYMLAAVVAVISGASVGYVASKMDTLKQQASALFASVPPPEPLISVDTANIQKPVSTIIISKKQVATATLRVADVSGKTNTFIPLLLHAEPGFQQKDLLLKISGLPDRAYLTSGHREVDKDWALTQADTKNVKLMVLESQQQEIELSVSAFESGTGQLAAPVKAMTVALTDAKVQPAVAPPPRSFTSSATLPLAIPLPIGTNVASLTAAQSAARAMANGDLAMKSGDAGKARHHYEQAWLAGSADGAMGVARSYDPLHHGTLKLKDAAPDTVQALQWYERAAAAGKQEAIDAIARLKLKP